jgi:DNA-binding NarL/FixJ family response regulator
VVVLLDLIMPDTDTMAVLAKLRQPPYAPRVRVLILTTIGSDTAVRRCMAAGAHGFLVKGSTAHQLATAVRAVADGLVAVGAGAATPDGVPPGSAPPASNGRPSVDRRLTPRETEVLQLLGEGLSNREIANRLRLSERTIKIHVSAVLGKLGVQSRTQAALAARTRIGGDG